jgi:hypothetical protein
LSGDLDFPAGFAERYLRNPQYIYIYNKIKIKPLYEYPE